jgi:hypothetical protein
MTIEQLGENAANCAILAEEATDEPSRRRYQRMHDAWLALIETEAWLDGAMPSKQFVGAGPSASTPA